MSWWNPGGIFTGGVDLDAEQQKSQALDAQLKDQNQQLVERGLWTQDQADTANANIDTASDQGGMNDTNGAVATAAGEGLKEGLNNVLAAPGKIVGGVTGGAGQILWGILKGVPWWLWLLAIGGLFFYLGGGPVLEFLARKKIKSYAK